MAIESRRSALIGATTTIALAVATGCRSNPKSVDLVAAYPKVREVMDELFVVLGALQASVAVLDADTWRGMLPEIKKQTQKASMAASKMGMTLRFPTS
jgi:hypothetical protein